LFAQFLLFGGSSQSPKGAARFRAGRAAAVFDEAALIPAAERGEAARGAHAPSPDSDVRAGAISHAKISCQGEGCCYRQGCPESQRVVIKLK
tara:strand:- start:165 stop:440 length:276 start_codon:yes stop_codon:yes gene_type:complete